MADILQTGVSALLAFQRALNTTGHNIANANTEGYSRQRVDLAARQPQGYGFGFIGNGVDVTTVQRVIDGFRINQARFANTSLGSLDAFQSFATQVDDVLGDPNTGIASGLQSFFNAWQDVANDPASIPARQLLVSEAQSIAGRFNDTSTRLESLNRDINTRISDTVSEINTLSGSIAQLNNDIVTAQAGLGQPPNDLMDQRDVLLDKLASLTGISVVTEADGAVNVFTGSGQALVMRAQSLNLGVALNTFDPSRVDVTYTGGGVSQVITSSLSGSGEIGGLIDVRTQLLDPARNTLGQLATALATSVNAQHHEGMTLQGALGGDMFQLSVPQALASATNTGAASVSVTISDIGGLTADDYVLRFSAGAYSLVRVSTGQAVAMTGTGTVADPFVAEGLSIVTSGAAANGDQFLLRPTRESAATLTATISDPRALAAAAPIRSSALATNTGNATISSGEVLDATNPALLSSVTIQFLTANTYSVNGAGSFAYTAGGNIDVNGWRVQISGTPVAGDTFSVQSNAGGVGDNRNALNVARLQSLGVLAGGSASIAESFTSLVGSVGAQTHQTGLNLAAQQAITSQAHAAVQEVAGVNLDEEAADLLRWQQAYQAAAQTISVADTLFQTLISVVSR